MQYHITERVHGRQWENEQQAVVDSVRRRAQHDLEAQNPGSTVTINGVDHAVRGQNAPATTNQNVESYLVEFTVEYTLSGQPNTFAA